jgi:hypothetical protein
VLDPPSAHNIAGADSESRIESKHPRFRRWKRPFSVLRMKHPQDHNTKSDATENLSEWRREPQ